MKITRIIFLIVSLIVIIIPRFNWGKLGPFSSFVGEKPFDVEQYVTYTEYFRGVEDDDSQLKGPFSYRPLIPLLASIFPFDPLTSINIVNILFLLAGLYFIIEILKIYKFKGNYLFLGGILFVYSFPVFYYGTSGYIDSVLVAFVAVGTYFILKEKLFYFILTFIFGMAVKETIIILIPVFVIYMFVQNRLSLIYKFIFTIAIISVYFIISIVLRKFTPGGASYLWYPSFHTLGNNLLRIKTYWSIALTFGVPGIGVILYFYHLYNRKIKFTNEAPLIAGFLIAILISIFSLFAAYADGRHLWTSYPFTIPLSLLYLRSRGTRGIKN